MAQIYISPQKRLALSFSFFTVLTVIGIILGIVMTSYGTEVIITPRPQDIDVNFTLTVKTPNLNNDTDNNTNNQDNNTKLNENTLKGYLFENTQSGEEIDEPKAIVSMEGYAEGEVILTNQTWSPVNFVAATRFESPSGLIFRAVNKMHVPAKDKTTVHVRADKPGSEYQIDPTNFTIPALTSPSLKNNILVESLEPMIGGIQKTGIIMQSDIDQSFIDLEEKLSQKGIQEIKEELAEKDLKIILQKDILEKETDGEADQEKAEFTSKMKIKITAIAIKESELLDQAIDYLKKQAPKGFEITAYEKQSLSARIKSANIDQKTGEVEVQFRGQMIVTQENEILNPSTLTGKRASEIVGYFDNFKEVQGIKVRFWPPFVNKSSENADKIKIKIK